MKAKGIEGIMQDNLEFQKRALVAEGKVAYLEKLNRLLEETIEKMIGDNKKV